MALFARSDRARAVNPIQSGDLRLRFPVMEDFPDMSGHQVYACGAPIVVDSARADFARAGLPAEEFFADSFTSEADKAA